MNTKKEKLLFDTYRSFIDQCLGRIKPDSLNEILSEKAMGFGTTADEKIFGVEEFHKLLLIQKEQSEGLEMDWELDPLSRYVNSNENLAAFAEDLHLTVAVNGEKIKMYLRISIIMEYKNDKWIIIHWHGSKPENVQSEEDTFGIESWKQKVDELEKLVADRTADLVEKNRELEIETSLEKIRAVAMSMMKPDDLLNICQIQFSELTKLGFSEIRNALIEIFNDERKYITDYDYSDFCGGAITQIPYHKNSEIDSSIKQMKSATDAFTETVVKGKELEEWKTFRQKNGEYEDARLNNITVLYYYFYSVKAGSVGISTFKKISEEQLLILKRIRNVFDLAYQRYTDISLAEAQAREAQMEVALERVRARAMSMQHSEELADTASILFQQIKSLGFETWSCGFCTWKDNDIVEVWMGADSGGLLPPMLLPYKKEPTHHDIYNASLTGQDSHEKIWEGKELDKHYDFLRTLPSVAVAIKQLEDAGLSLPTKQCYYVGFFNHGYLLLITKAPNEEMTDIGKRFAKVFEQAYTRFLDLQKSEAQAREAEIELALERVRAKTMAMQHSNELLGAATLLFQQVELLGAPSWNCSFNIWDEDKKMATAWNGTKEGFGRPFKSNSSENVYLEFYEGGQKGEKLFIKEIGGTALENHYHYMSTVPGVGETLAELKAAGVALPTFQIFYIAYFAQGYLMFITYEAVPEFHEIFKRFAKVFEQTYTRFLDLQKAEEQTREAQVEAALEKVRSRSLAMHKTDELQEVVTVVLEKMTDLNIELDTININIYKEDSKELNLWTAAPGQKYAVPFHLPFFDHPFHTDIFTPKESGLDFFTKTYSFEEKNNYFNYTFEHSDFKYVPEDKKKLILDGRACTRSIAMTKNAGIIMIRYSEKPFSENENEILKRFAKVFEQAYTRFLDLQKAEAQAKEAHIEAALEKVRSRSMGMQKSEELKEVIKVVYEQFVHLNINVEHTGFIMDYKTRDDMHIWLADQHEVPSEVFIPYFDSAHWNSFREAKEKGTDFFPTLLDFEEKNKFYKDLFALIPGVPEETLDYYFSCPGLAGSTVLLDNVSLYIENFQGIPYTDEENNTLMRFGKVFQQTYTRFLDLQKAEAQAREAQIEAALERTRTQSMIMQHSNELNDTLRVFHEQILQLNIPSAFSFLWLPDEEKNKHLFWAIWEENKNDAIAFKDKAINYQLDRNEPATAQCLIDWKSSEPVYSYAVPPEGVENYFATWHELIDGVEKLKPEFFPGGLYYVEAFMKYGCFGVMVENDLSEVEKKILYRFAVEFERTYTRFLDLQKAEAQAREAQIETALEKVRSRTLAMQKSDELADTSIVIFEQLINLGIEPNRLFIGIVNEKTHSIEAWATNEDGTKIGNHFTLNTDKNKSVKKMYAGWKEKKSSITIDMTGEELQNYFHYLSDEMHIPFKDGLSQKRRIQTIAYFGQGLIGMASPDEQPEATTQLLERFAAVFNLTYTRFNDLKIAEAHAIQAEEDLVKLQIEKRRAEEALTNLKAAQSQLVQSEKMASLGELTAGIAHEIQNPLNFVNNFSEVSQELLDEMKEEMDKGNLDDVKEIMNDVIQNLEKINHHGKRADAIVKGMLQHSQSSKGQKEPTDINALCDEYLRLSYHGLRAKDKSFNAEMKTDFDNSIGKINIIPQDIGRVVLNLINNAFYAVAEKKKLNIEGYEPTVFIQSKKTNDIVEIKVSDNGNGIPQNIVDKIFQPFFTTKPTGQGTGLGLSLSYDIVKAHGGEIKVGTREGEGTTFKIIMPITNTNNI